MPYINVDFTGTTFRADHEWVFPYYVVYIPHKVVVGIGSCGDVPKSLVKLAAFLAALPGVPPAAPVLFAGLAVWMTAEFFFIQLADKGQGVNLTAWFSPVNMIWVPSAAT